MEFWESEEFHQNFLFLQTILSGTVIVNTFLYKVPQVYDILSYGSTAGLSLPSTVTEGIAYTIMLTYQYAMEYPLETYAENSIMVVEDIILAVVILYKRNQMDLTLIPWTIIYIVGSVSIAMKWLPDAAMLTLMGSTTLILCYSKLDQLFNICWARDAGVVSRLTWFIACYDTAVRMLTTAVITKDIPMFINLSSSEVLNVAIFVSIIYYQNTEWKRWRQRTDRQTSRDPRHYPRQ